MRFKVSCFESVNVYIVRWQKCFYKIDETNNLGKLDCTNPQTLPKYRLEL